MHDIDRTGGYVPEYGLYETGDSFEMQDAQEALDALEGEPFELGGQYGYETADFGVSAEVAFGDSEEAALAGELLGVSNEAELDYFLGSLIKKAAGGVGKFISSLIPGTQ